jgi:hypothetical protein
MCADDWGFEPQVVQGGVEPPHHARAVHALSPIFREVSTKESSKGWPLFIMRGGQRAPESTTNSGRCFEWTPNPPHHHPNPLMGLSFFSLCLPPTGTRTQTSRTISQRAAITPYAHHPNLTAKTEKLIRAWPLEGLCLCASSGVFMLQTGFEPATSRFICGHSTRLS